MPKRPVLVALPPVVADAFGLLIMLEPKKSLVIWGDVCLSMPKTLPLFSGTFCLLADTGSNGLLPEPGRLKEKVPLGGARALDWAFNDASATPRRSSAQTYLAALGRCLLRKSLD